jgi:hypothetical protein
VIDLARRSQGATLAEIMELTGWQAHTVRGFISGTLMKKLGLKVESFRSKEKERTAHIIRSLTRQKRQRAKTGPHQEV